MTQSKSEFDVWDWLLFSAMLIISAGIGIFYACRRQKTTTDFLMGGRNMQLVPVAISILLSFMSAIFILGTTAEMYTQGTQYFIYQFGISLAVLLVSQLFVPLLYPLQLTSSFEYLELRFNSKAAKLTGTTMMILEQVIYMGVASFAPSTALEAVTRFPTWATIITVGVVSTFYTCLWTFYTVVESMSICIYIFLISMKGEDNERNQSHNSYKQYKIESWANTDPWVYQKWDQVPGRSKYPLSTGHTRRDLYILIICSQSQCA